MFHGESAGVRGQRRVPFETLLIAPLVTAAAPAWAGPEGQQVVAGSASFARQGSVTTIHAANNTIINYTGFNIAGHETVRFVQPDASSRVLNRISGAAPTHIDGTLLSNGIVYIVNPAGVVFGQGSVIDVGGLHAAAANITNSDFLRGIERYTDAKGSVVNHGTIVSPDVMLFGRAVENTGSVISPGGVVAFVAGEDLYLGERGGHLYLKVEGGGAASGGAGGVRNAGAIDARGGQVMVGAGDMFGVALHASSHVRADRVEIQGGKGAVTSVSGVIDAASTEPGGTGGEIRVVGDRVGLYEATLDASGEAGGGTIRVGGDFHGGDGARASRTYVSEGSTLRADALGRGDGGTVVVWADEVTRFAGEISAQGGARGGDGGAAEVSGKESLVYAGFTDLRASAGKRGTLLLDPKNILIAGGGGDTIPGDTAFADASSDDRTFSPATVVSALDGADLVLQANNDITVSSDIDASGNAGSGSLTLQAGRSILIDADVTLKGNFTAIANDTDAGLVAAERDPGEAVFAMSPGTTIDTSATGGNIVLHVLEGGAADQTAGTITLGSLHAGAGHVMMRYGGITANRGIARADGSSLVSAASLVIGANGAGGGGFIGTEAEPILMSVSNLRAVSQGGGAFFSNDKDLTIGGTGFGGLTGISVASFGGSGTLDIEAAGSLTVSEAVTSAGDLRFRATNGITIDANVAANTAIAGSTLLASDTDDDNASGGDSDPLVIAIGRTLATNGSDLSLLVGDLDLSGAIDAGAGTVTIAGSGAAGLIGVGTGVAGTDVSISRAELQRIAAGDLSIGDAGTTSLTVGTVASSDLAGIAGGLTLEATHIDFQSSASFTSLTASAADTVTVLGSLSTTDGDLTLVGDADGIGGGGERVVVGSGVTLVAGGGLSVTATNGIDLSGAAGTQNIFAGETVTLADVAGAADVRIQSTGDVVTDAISIGSGALTVEIDAGDEGMFAASLGAIDAGSVAIAAGNNDAVTFTGAVSTSGAAGVDIDGGAVRFQGPVNAAGSGLVRVTNVGMLTIEEGAPIAAGGGFTQDGTGAVSLGASITTTGDAVSFSRAVTLADTASDLVSIDTTAGGNAAGASISFSSTLNAASAGAQSITLDAGTGGDLSFGAGVGSLARLGTLTITNARNVTASLAVQATAIRQVAGQQTTTFNGAVTAIGGGIDLDGNAFTFNGTVNAANGGLFQVTNAGTLTFGPNAAVTATGGLTQDGAGAVVLGAGITTTGDAVSFAGPVTLADTASDLVTITTTSGPVLAGANVAFGSTVDATAAGGQSLTIDAGTGGDITFAAGVGGTRLGTLTVVNARDVIASSSVSAAAVRQLAGQRLTRFDGTVGTNTAAGIDLDGAAFTFNGAVTTTGGGIVRVTNAGMLTLAEGASIASDGAITQDGSGGVSLGGNITTTGDAISFAGPVTLADTATDLVTLDTTTGGNVSGGAVSFASTVNGTGAGAQSLTVNAGTGGDVAFTGAVGGGTRVGTLTITNARDVIASSSVSAAAVRQLAGQRLTRFDGTVGTNAAAGIDLDGTAFTFNDDVTAAGGGIVRVTNTGLLTLADGAPITAQGGFTQDGAGAVSLGASIATSGGAVSFAGPVTLADTASDLVTIGTTNGGVGAGADIAFLSTINGTAAGGQSLTLNAGTGGDVSLGGAVGGTTRLGTLTVTNADAVTTGAVTANAIRQVAGQGVTRLNGAIATSGAAGVDLDGAAFEINAPITTTGGGVVRITNSGTLAVNSSVSASGVFAQDGTGPVTLGAGVAGSGVSFAGATTLSAPIGVTGGAGGVAFGSTLGAAGHELVITSGGEVSFGAAATGGGAVLRIRPTLESGAIDIGTITGGPVSGAMSLGAASVAQIDGFFGVEIGHNTVGTSHAVRVGTVTWNDPVAIHAGSGTITLSDGGITGAGNATVTLIGDTTLGAGITNSGRDVIIGGDVRVAQGAAVTLSTGAGAGNILITGVIEGTTGGGAESLTIGAGTGTIDLQGNVSGAGGAADATGLASLTFAGAAGVQVEGIAIAGALTTSAPLTGPFTADGLVSVGSLDMSGTTFTFNGGLVSAGSVSINNSGLLTLLSGLTAGGAIDIAGPALLAGVFDSTNNALTLGGAVTLGGDAAFNAGTGTLTIGAASTIATAGHDLTLTADAMSINAGAGAISSGGNGGAVVIQPATTTRGVALANPSVNPGTPFLAISAAEIAAFGDGFDSVTIGRSDGRHEMRVGTLAVSDPLTLRSPVGGSLFVGDGGIAGAGNASVTIDGSGATTTLGAGITTDGGDIVVSDSVRVGADVTLSTGAGASGDIVIEGAIDQSTSVAAGTLGLTLDAGLGDVDLRGAVGTSRAIASLNVSGADISVRDIGGAVPGVAGAASLQASDTLALRGDTYRAGAFDLGGTTVGAEGPATTIASSTGATIVTGSVRLAEGAGLTVQAATDATFNGTIDGTAGGSGETLTVQAGGVAGFNGDVGSDAALESVSVEADVAAMRGVTTTGSQEIRGTSGVTLSGDLASVGSGDVLLAGPVTLASAVRIESAGNAGDDVTLDGTVDGPFALAIDAGAGDVSLRGAVGGTDALDSLSAVAANIAIEAIGAAGEGVTGVTSIVGSTSISFTGDVYRANAQSYAAPVKTLGSGTTTFFSSGDLVTFSGGVIDMGAASQFAASTQGGELSIDSIIGTRAGHVVTLDSGTGRVVLGGVAIGGGGGSGAALTLTGDEIDLTGTVAGEQIVLQPSTPTLGITIAGGAFGPALNLTAAEMALLADGFSRITIGREDNGAHAITTGAITFRDPVRIVTPGGSVSVNGAISGTGDSSVRIESGGTTLNAGIAAAGGAITLDSPTALGADVTLASQGGTIGITGAIDGAHALTLNAGAGEVTLDGAIGGTTPLASLISTASRTTLPGAATSGSQSYTGGVVATGAAPAFTTGGGAGDDITFGGTLDGAGDFTIDAGAGRVSFAGNIGTATRPASLNASGSLVSFGGSSVRAAGAIDIDGAARTYDAGAGMAPTITFRTDDGAIRFRSTLDGVNAIVLNAGSRTVMLDGVVGGLAAPASLDVTGGSILAAGATTIGNQTYRGPVGVQGDAAAFATGSGSIAFQQTLDGAADVTLRAPQGTIGFGGDVGDGAALRSIDAEGAAISLASITTTGFQRLIGSVAAPSSVVLTTGGTSGANITLGAMNGAGGLRLDAGAGGDITFTQPVGATTPLGDVIVANARNVTAGSIAAGSFTQLAGTGLTTLNGLLSTSGAGGVDLNGTRFDILGGIAAGGSGPITITNSGELRLPASSISFGGAFTQDGPGRVLLGADLANAGRAISFAAPITLTGDVTLAGSAITLASGVASDATARHFTARSGGAMSFVGLGTESARLASLTVEGTGAGSLARLGGDIHAGGLVRIDPVAQIAGDVTVEGLGGVRFGSTIDAAAGVSPALEIVTHAPGSVPSSDHRQVPIIEFAGDVGADRPLRALAINPGGLASAPPVATITAHEGVSVAVTDEFRMGRNEKLSVLGDLAINAGEAFVGDISTLGNMRIDAGRIVILTREPGRILGPQTEGTDQGVDFVAKDEIGFSTTPEIDGDGLIFFATETGAGFSSSLSGFSQRAFGALTQDLFLRDQVVLDLRAQGPTNTNVSEAIAGAAPRESQSGSVRRGTSIGAAQEEELRQIGVDPRGLGVETLLEALVGRALYNDLPNAALYEESKVSERRLSAEIVESTLRAARDVLGESTSPRFSELRAHLQTAVDAYLEETGASRVWDGAAFRAFVRSRPDLAPADAELDGLARLFDQLRLLGLTEFELENAWRQISRRMELQGIHAGTLRAAFQVDASGDAVSEPDASPAPEPEVVPSEPPGPIDAVPEAPRR